MAEKKFAGINGTVTGAEVSADYEAAPVFDKVRVGKLGVYFRDGFKTRFMDYSLLERVFIRIQEVNGRMCCGNATFAYYRLVFVVNGKEFVDTISENEKAMDDALAKIKESAPNVAIGFVGKE
jgi:hypothetical protein